MGVCKCWSAIEVCLLSMVSEYPNVFPKEFLGIALDREIEFFIDLVPSKQLVSIPPYCIPPVELEELRK